MASTTSIKDTGIPRLLFLGLLLPSVLVSGQITAPTTTTFQASSNATSLITTNPATAPSSTGGLDTMNSTSAWPTSVMTQIYCPSFSCSSSECYSMYMSQNATLCAAANYCQLLRSTNMWYNVSCSSSCAERCINSSQTNCSVNCCNSTGCLNATFSSMMVTTTMATTTTTAKPSQPATTTTTTTANNGNKCQTGTCNGDTCYTSFKDKTETCSSSQPHCQLRKDIKDSITTWTAGCSNCTDLAACTASTASPCVLECCKAATISCLRLNGTSNVLSFATRGPHLHKELIVSSLCLLALTLLL